MNEHASLLLGSLALASIGCGDVARNDPAPDDAPHALPPLPAPRTCRWSSGGALAVPDTVGAYVASLAVDPAGSVALGYDEDDGASHRWHVRDLDPTGASGDDSTVFEMTYPPSPYSLTLGATYVASHGADGGALAYDSLNGCRYRNVEHHDGSSSLGPPVDEGDRFCFSLAPSPDGVRWLETSRTQWNDLGAVRVVRAGLDGTGPKGVVESVDPGAAVVSAVDWAPDEDGSFVAVWAVPDGSESARVRAGAFDADGTALGGTIDLGAGSDASSLRVAGAGGHYVATWLAGDAGGAWREVMVAAFDASAQIVAPATALPGARSFALNNATVAAELVDGEVLVAWSEAVEEKGTSGRVLVQAVTLSGAPRLDPVALGAGDASFGGFPTIARSPGGAMAVFLGGVDEGLAVVALECR